MPEKQMKKNKVIGGLEPNIAAVIAYAGVWLTGLIFLLLEKENDFVRFHASQSVVAFGSLTVIGMIPFFGWWISPLLGLAGFILWVILIIKAYQGERYKLPVVGDWAEKLIAKIK